LTAADRTRVDNLLAHLRTVGAADKRAGRSASDSALTEIARAYDRATSTGPDLIGRDVTGDMLQRMRAAYLAGRGPQHIASVPPLRGRCYGDFDGRYRSWTHAHGLQFDDVPSHEHGGPVLVGNGWDCSIGPHDDEVTLRASRGQARARETHPLDGHRFPTVRDAQRAAYAAGLLAYQVYERHAAAYGLPTGPAPPQHPHTNRPQRIRQIGDTCMAITMWLFDRIAALGDRLAERFDSRRYTMARELAETVAQGHGDFGALFCYEVNALARLLAAFGFDRVAVNGILAHSEDDHPDDTHGHISDWDTAEVYLKRLMGDGTAQPRDAADKRAELAILLAARDGDGTFDLDDQERLVQLRLELGQDPDDEPAHESDCC